MRLAILVLAAAATASACQAAAPAAISPEQFFGIWQVSKINAYGEVTQSQKDMDALLGARLVLSANKMSLAGDPPCKVVGARVIMVDATDEASAPAAPSPAAAGLPARVAKLDDGCLNPYMVGSVIVFAARGAWYTARRIAP